MAQRYVWSAGAEINTTTASSHRKAEVLNILGFGSGSRADWEWTDHFHADMGVLQIQLYSAVSAGALDKCIFAINAASGPIVFVASHSSIAETTVIDFYGERLDLFLPRSLCTLSTGSIITIIATDRKMGPRH